MSYQDLLNYCLNKHGAVEEFPFGPMPAVIKVAGKMFALLSKENEIASISLKCDPHIAEMLRAQFESVQPGYHLNKRHWNTVTVDDSVPESELYWMIDHSYELVIRSLPKAERLKYSVD